VVDKPQPDNEYEIYSKISTNRLMFFIQHSC